MYAAVLILIITIPIPEWNTGIYKYCYTTLHSTLAQWLRLGYNVATLYIMHVAQVKKREISSPLEQD